MTTFQQGLLITAIGMALVFVMILALWGIMALLVKLTNKPEAEEEEPFAEVIAVETEKAPANDHNGALAAAIAVAWALQSQAAINAFAPHSTPASSDNAWLTAGRTQQLYSNTIRGRNR
ncbi:MAG: OadG family protein [Anaerolineaceae bacterium]|jgi:Na+-transporting methylmalonyl-CoA/oxaloacetate decarboxylase gamma subunit|nr:OadG family protein [Anaerolineaceae bacterium]MDD4043041.1 OadG family protein [Anaerolineaceae bacterium]MDD4577281.1 OadG family protein [Anaerolineaceae bacterium]